MLVKSITEPDENMVTNFVQVIETVLPETEPIQDVKEIEDLKNEEHNQNADTATDNQTQ